jgi:hypothetical protein
MGRLGFNRSTLSWLRLIVATKSLQFGQANFANLSLGRKTSLRPRGRPHEYADTPKRFPPLRQAESGALRLPAPRKLLSVRKLQMCRNQFAVPGRRHAERFLCRPIGAKNFATTTERSHDYADTPTRRFADTFPPSADTFPPSGRSFSGIHSPWAASRSVTSSQI